MFIVTITNNGIETVIHGDVEKLQSGKIVKGINSIDSFSFSILPSNVGFGLIREFSTLVSVYNTNQNRYEFIGRVLYPETSMSDSGLIVKTVTCESIFGYLCDSAQKYIDTKNWTVEELLRQIISCHNSQVEEYKRFNIGNITASDDNDNIYIGIQRENTWDTLKSKLVDKIGGEFQYRIENGKTYIDYLEHVGETKGTEIALSVNMKSITREQDPTEFVTRLIPLGCKTSEDTESEERLDITSVNGGVEYIDDEEAVEAYGIHVGVITWDDVTTANVLLTKARNWLTANNKVQVKYSITALDLSLLGLEIEDFDVGNFHPIKNALIGIDDTARIIKKNIDICEEIKSTIEVGDNFKTLSDIQQDQAKKAAAELELVTQKMQSANNSLKADVENKISGVRDELSSTVTEQSTDLTNTCTEIVMQALEAYVKTNDYEAFRKTVTAQFSIMHDEMTMKFAETNEQLTSDYGELQGQFTELRKYISFSESGIVIGSGDNAITLQLDSDNGIIFSRDGEAFGRWDGVDFYTGNIIVEVNKRAQLGNFAFVPRSDGSLTFLKVGG